MAGDRPRVLVFERQHKLANGEMVHRNAIPIDQIVGWTVSLGTKRTPGKLDVVRRGITIRTAHAPPVSYADADGSIEALLEYLLGPVDVQLVETVDF